MVSRLGGDRTTDSAHEHLTVLERKELSARQVHAALRLEGEEELARSNAGLFWSAVACGLSLGLSLIAHGVLRHHVTDPSWGPVIAPLGYTVGFIALILGRQELYTGNTLTAVLPYLHERRRDTLQAVLRVWGVVFIGNILGAFVFASGAAWTTAFSEPLSRTFAEIGAREASYSFGTAFVKGVFGGWIVALMIWLMPGAHHARIWVIALLAWALAAAELTHVIAGSVDVIFAAWWGHVSWVSVLGRFIAPVFLGNTVGGIVFVALLNHVQVAADDRHVKDEIRLAEDLDRPE